MAHLALATSGAYGEIGLEVARGRLRVAPLGAGAARGRGLVPAVQKLLDESGLKPADLAGIAVDVGPGSFTGVRVGVTVAKALAWSRALPVAAVTSLDALARAAPPEREVLAIRDAGRGRLYGALYGREAAGARARLHEPVRAPAAEILSLLGRRLAVGEDAPAILARAACGGQALALRAGAAAVLAQARAAGTWEASAHALVPVYLQASAPERRRQGEKDGVS